MPPGLNNNAYQISRGEFYNRKVGGGVQQRCSFVKGDFMKMPFPENTFDAVYEIDATCHSPDVVNCYKVCGMRGLLVNLGLRTYC